MPEQNIDDAPADPGPPRHNLAAQVATLGADSLLPTKPGVAQSQLRAIVERIEHLEEEKDGFAEDIREVYAEAKGYGFDVRALRTVVRLRAMDKAERQEQEAVLDTYLNALGMF